uniref:Uncharacterized protein n=1 Tax=Timema tahoe TaxID=61484 RepID=A0A7R9ILD3_9NEOP|nr:unnamed protein product [Timema tahoe]
MLVKLFSRYKKLLMK